MEGVAIAIIAVALRSVQIFEVLIDHLLWRLPLPHPLKESTAAGNGSPGLFLVVEPHIFRRLGSELIRLCQTSAFCSTPRKPPPLRDVPKIGACSMALCEAILNVRTWVRNEMPPRQLQA
jgi:hypothetical protein